MPKEYRTFTGAVLTAAAAVCTAEDITATGKSLTSAKTYHLVHTFREGSQ